MTMSDGGEVSAADLRKMARAHLPEIISSLQELAQSTDRRIAADAQGLLARATKHLEPATPVRNTTGMNSIKGNQPCPKAAKDQAPDGQ